MKKALAIGLMLGTLPFLAGCDERKTVSVSVMQNNQSKDSVYLWVGERGTPEPTDSVAPGQFRNLLLNMNIVKSNTDEKWADHIRANYAKTLDGKVTTEYQDLSAEFTEGKTVYIRWSDAGFKTDY